MTKTTVFQPSRVVAVVPCNDLAASREFYTLLGFAAESSYAGYAILSDGLGGDLHLTKAPDGWLIPGKSPFGIYIYADDVQGLAARLGDRLLQPPKLQPWGTFEFAISDPDGNLVPVGRRVSST